MMRELILAADRAFRTLVYWFAWVRIIFAFALIAAIWIPAFLFAWWGTELYGFFPAGILGFLAWMLFLRFFVPPVYSIGKGAVVDGWRYLMNRVNK